MPREAWRIELDNLRETQRANEKVVRDLGGSPMLNAMRKSVLQVERTSKEEAKVDRGWYRASITPEVEVSPDGHEIIGIIGSNLAYSPFVVLDTKPHFPPIEALIGWVHRKRIAGRYSVKTKRRLGTKKQQAREDRRVAFAVARKIAQHGTEGDYSLFKGIEKNEGKILKWISDAIDQILTAWGED